MTILDTIIHNSELPPVTLQLDTKSIIQLSIALLIVIAIGSMIHVAITKSAK